MIITKQITKTSYEEFFRYHEFKRVYRDGWLVDEETISTASVTATDPEGHDVSSAMISEVGVYDNTKVKYKIKAGDAGKAYTIIIKIVTSAGQKFEDQLELVVT